MNIFHSEQEPARLWVHAKQDLVEQIMADRASKGLSPRKILESDLICKYYSLWLACDQKDNTKRLMGHPLLSREDHQHCT